MIERMADYILKHLEMNSTVYNDDTDIIKFGLELQITKIIIYFFVLMVAAFTDGFLTVMVFMLAYQPLRCYCGGYHANTKIACITASVAMLCFVIFVSKITAMSNLTFVWLLLIIISGVVIFCFAPVATKNKPLDEIEIAVYGKRARINYMFVLLLSIIFSFFDLSAFLIPIAAANCFVAAFLLIGIIKNRKE